MGLGAIYFIKHFSRELPRYVYQRLVYSAEGFAKEYD